MRALVPAAIGGFPKHIPAIHEIQTLFNLIKPLAFVLQTVTISIRALD